MSTISQQDWPSPGHSAPAPRQPGRIRAWLGRIGTTGAVLLLLGGLAAIGHFSDWQLPKFSELMSGGAAQPEMWCTTHNVSEEACIECNPALAPVGKWHGWCKEHGVAECPLEHPEVAQLAVTPTITPADLERARRALDTRPRAENSSRCLTHQRRIQFASVEAMEKAGVDIAVVEERPLVEAISANGEVVYDADREAHLASRSNGTVWRVEKQVGDPVRRGDILALIDASEVGRYKANLLEALPQLRLQQSHVDRLTPLSREGAVPGKQLREAEAALEAAKISILSAQQALVNLGLTIDAKDLINLPAEEVARQIQFLGLPSFVVASIDTDTTTSNLLPVVAPLDGVVVKRDVVSGEVVTTATTLFTVADTRQMWLTLAVRQEDAHYVQMGQTVLFEPSDAADETILRGTVAWLSTAADEQTRSVAVRATLENLDGELRANTFGTGRIVLREEPRAIVVPNEAIHWDGDCSIVFVRDKNWFQKDAPKFFHVRKVRLGVREDGATEIIAGLLPGEVIASKNSYVLQAQLLKSNLGAGCGCAHGH
jgi:cobalt-zinc-cadmium efflux system membrane fusion protein